MGSYKSILIPKKKQRQGAGVVLYRVNSTA